MKYKLKCLICGETVWTTGTPEPDVNAVSLDDNDPLDEACQHIKDGGSFEIVDEEAEEYDDNYM